VARDVWLMRSGEARRKCAHEEGAAHVVVAGACPACGFEPFNARGIGVRPAADDRAWESDAVALCCRAAVGVLRVEANTIFGVREDEAVLHGRWRVY
jgi:hypothetical protein